MEMQLPQTLAHFTTAALSLHMQKFALLFRDFCGKQNEISIDIVIMTEKPLVRRMH